MSLYSRRTPALVTVAVLAASSLGAIGLSAVGLGAAASAASSSVVISEVYGGGGNSGAQYNNDFVELYNTSSSPVDVTGWTVAYFSAAGGAATPVTPLSGSIAAHRTYLVQEAAGTTGGAASLPSPDATGTLNMSASSGRVDLTDGSQNLIDRVGYGSATTFEGTGPAPGLSNTTSDARVSPCGDTDNNSADFAAGAPTPENAAVTDPVCTQSGGGGGGTPATIDQIQGAAHISPLKGQAVTGVEGVVTATSTSGFWFQSTHPDNDPATSEGLFVFTSSAPTVSVGDDVSVNGTVAEFRPGGSSGTQNLTITELESPTITVNSTGNALPAPVIIGVDRVPPAQTVTSEDPGTVESPTYVFDPSTNAIDFDESLEGMRIAERNARVTGPTNTEFGETPIVPGGTPGTTRTPHGGVLYSGYDTPNSARLIMADSLLPSGTGPVANVGDRLAGLTVGIMDYDFDNFYFQLTQAPTVVSANLQREVTKSAAPTQLAVATFNVENLAPSDPATKFQHLATQIVHNLQAPDIVAVEEVQDNDGATDDGVVDASVTLTDLTQAIAAAGGPTYSWAEIDPVNDQDGGEPGGNIRQVFLYRTDRGLTFTSIPGGGSTVSTTVLTVKGKPQLSASPGRIDPGNDAWDASRKPLVGQFTWKGKPFFVIANHFDSKLGDDPLFGRFQQPERPSETQRHEQATEVRSFVDQIQAVDPSARVIVLGDLNDFQFSQTADILVGSGAGAMTDLPRTLPLKQQYTYVYEGNSEVLDHILITTSWPSAQYDIVHTNSEFSDQDSDHDPQVVRLRIG